MDTRTLCLGALTFGEATGYELKKTMEQSFGHFLDVSYAAIYPALAELHRQGLVDCREVRQRTRPDKKIYRINAAGRDAFRQSLLNSPGRHRLRSEFLALVFFAEFLPPGHIQQVAEARITEFEAVAQQAERLLAEEPDLPPGIRFAAGYGVTICRTAATYIREHRHLLNSPPDEATTPRSAYGES